MTLHRRLGDVVLAQRRCLGDVVLAQRRCLGDVVLAQRRCNVMTLHLRLGDVVLTSCACWDVTNCYTCIQLYTYVTHGNVNVLRLCTTVRICNTWTS